MSAPPEPLKPSEVREHFGRRQRESLAEKNAYETWLNLLTPLRWITVTGGIVLSAAAGGVALLAEYRVGYEDWRIYGAVCAIIASILTGIHTSLNCDAHQTECRRLVQVYSGLEAAFEAAPLMKGNRLDAKFDELEAKFIEAKSEAAASPPQWCRRRSNSLGKT